MRTIWHSLVWKEWHEHKWKLAALTAVLCGVNGLMLMSWSRETLASSFMMTTMVALPLALFMGSSAAASERSQGTADFLAALPVPAWRVALGKLVTGLATLSVALAASYFFAFLWYSYWTACGRDMEPIIAGAWKLFPPQIRLGNWFASSAITAAVAAGSIFLWTAAAGVNRADEVSAGARAVLVMAAWWGLLIMIGLRLEEAWFEGSGRKVIATIVTASPAGAVVEYPKFQSAVAWAGSPLPAVIALLVHLGLAAWFVYRFGRVSKRWFRWNLGGAGVGELAGWLGPPRRSQFGAIAWKQVRESGPVVLAGFAGALGLTVLLVATNWDDARQRPATIALMFGAMTGAFSIVITLVVGIGVSLTDLSPSLNTFWRSRPINPDTWFWTKFATGLLVLVATLLLPVFALAGILRLGGSSELWDEFVHPGGLGFIAANVAIYITAMTMTCLVRHAIYGAVLAIGTLIVGPMVVMITLGVCDRWIWKGELMPISEWYLSVLIQGSIAVVVIATLIVGWLAMRSDWGWKKG